MGHGSPTWDSGATMLGYSHPSMPPRVPTARTLPGRSRPGRLRLLDRYLELREQALLEPGGSTWDSALYADIGVGDQAHTTAEWAAWLRTRQPQAEVVGVDATGWRVEAARRDHAAEGLRFVQGNFVAPGHPPLRVVRAMNLLRGYAAAEVSAAWRSMGLDLLPGGLLVEGCTDQPGAVLVAHLLRRTSRGLEHQGLLFATDRSRGFAPAMFRGPLPRAVRGRTDPGAETRAFLDRWTAAWEPTRGLGGPPAMLSASAATLRASGEAVDASPDLLEAGMLVWRAPALVSAFSLALDAGTP